MLNRLREYGLKLSPEKYRFFQTSVRYLGHIVSANEVETDPEKIEAIKTWPIPTTLKQLRSFLGFAGYYRRFIKDYSVIAKPLNDLTQPDLHQLPVIPALDMKEKQHADPCIRELIHQLETGEKIPPTARAELPELPLLLREWSKLMLMDGILYRRRGENEDLSYQLVLPPELHPLVLRSLHDDMGHMGIERTLDLVRSRFFWPKMAMDVEQKIKSCGRCVCGHPGVDSYGSRTRF